MEAAFTIGVMSFSFLALAPLLGMGMKTARWARTDRASAQVARTLVEEARQGTLGTNPVYLDDQGAPCSFLDARFVAQPVMQPTSNLATELTIRVTPVGAPGRARVYAVVLPAAEQK